MRKLFPLFAVAALFTGITMIARADEKKEITVTGEGVCAKCALKETPKCQNVVTVKEDGKEVKYYLAANKASTDYHKASGICSASTDAPVKTKVTGTVEEKDGKKVLTASKVEKAD